MAEVEHSDTDSSDDEDYKPETEEHIEDISDDGQDESESSDECDGTRKRGRQSRKKKRKKEENDVAEEKSMTAEDEKKRADALWADFLTDVDAPPPKPTETPKDIPQHTKPTPSPSNSQEVAPKKSIEIFDFAGEAVEVAVENTPKPTKRPAQVARSSRSGGISSVLGTLGKKPKISTLEKTKLDWDRFKTTEGIGEDLERFNKGKDGYLERQDFLERTDYRQFDREREMRQNKRSTR